MSGQSNGFLYSLLRRRWIETGGWYLLTLLYLSLYLSLFLQVHYQLTANQKNRALLV
uniref:Uncharacterized protein n=1 Tax=viral metagenome TaxID=1070528 RepID=A0A6C0F0M1_9ZZZZ